YLLKLDIENFFPTISQGRIFDNFMALNLRSEIAKNLSRFVTIDGSLPLGFPTSPVISNAIALPIDIALHRLAQQVGNVTYTRYADDLSFSGDGNLPTVDDIQKCVNASGFTLAHAKTRWSKIGRAHYVTGLSVSDTKQPHVPRVKKRVLRQELHYATKFGIIEHSMRKGIADVQGEINRLDGLVKFVAHHEPRLSGKLKQEWREILLKSGMRPS
ncbi:reverse transcriptase family protein, partial [Nostoc sp. NIES-2111]